MNAKDRKNLKKRYLIWFYKVTKEALDKIERKFTQTEIDRTILGELRDEDECGLITNFVDDFEAYIETKEKEGMLLKYKGGKPEPDFLFLELKLKAIEKIIIEELGKKTLNEIKALYENEMTQRILKNTEH